MPLVPILYRRTTIDAITSRHFEKNQALTVCSARVAPAHFKGLDDFIDKHRDDVTVPMLGEHYGWFVEATEACGA